MNRPFSLLGAFSCTLAVAAIGFLPTEATPLPPIMVEVALLVPALVVGIPFAIWLPRARVPFFRDAWRLPKTTLLLTRPMVCLIGTSMLGLAGGLAVLAVCRDIRLVGICGVQILVTVSLLASATGRFRQPSSHEFVQTVRLRR